MPVARPMSSDRVPKDKATCGNAMGRLLAAKVSDGVLVTSLSTPTRLVA